MGPPSSKDDADQSRNANVVFSYVAAMENPTPTPAHAASIYRD